MPTTDMVMQTNIHGLQVFVTNQELKAHFEKLVDVTVKRVKFFRDLEDELKKSLAKYKKEGSDVEDEDLDTAVRMEVKSLRGKSTETKSAKETAEKELQTFKFYRDHIGAKVEVSGLWLNTTELKQLRFTDTSPTGY